MARVKNTPKKQKPIHGDTLRINQKFQSRQVSEVVALYEKMAKDVNATLEPILSSSKAEKLTGAAMDAGVTATASSAIASLRRKWNKIFSKKALEFTDRLVSESKRSTAKSINNTLQTAGVNQAIKIDSMSQRTRDILKAASIESVSQIKTISGAYMDSAASAVNYSVTQASSNFANLQEFFDKSLKTQYRTHRNKAKNLALDQTRNVYNSLASERMRDVGMTKYKWLHMSGSQEPRKEHIEMSGNIYDLNDPPVIDKKTGQKGNPGDIYNCKCVKVLIVDFSQFE